MKPVYSKSVETRKQKTLKLQQIKTYKNMFFFGKKHRAFVFQGCVGNSM